MATAPWSLNYAVHGEIKTEIDTGLYRADVASYIERHRHKKAILTWREITGKAEIDNANCKLFFSPFSPVWISNSLVAVLQFNTTNFNIKNFEIKLKHEREMRKKVVKMKF
jgi:hypothetical protein